MPSGNSIPIFGECLRRPIYEPNKWEISAGPILSNPLLGFEAQYLQSYAERNIVCAPSGMDRVLRPEFLAPSRSPSAYRQGYAVLRPASLSTCTARRFRLSPVTTGSGLLTFARPSQDHEPPGAPYKVPMRPSASNSNRPSGLAPAALLGLLGLPLIVAAGPASKLPSWAYASGLVLTIGLGLTTAMRTSRLERFAALVATALLAGLCLVQITHHRQAPKDVPEGQQARGARLPKEAGNDRGNAGKTANPTYEEKHDR